MSELLPDYKCAILAGVVRLRNTIYCTKWLSVSWHRRMNAYSLLPLKSEFTLNTHLLQLEILTGRPMYLFFSSSFTERNTDDTRGRSFINWGCYTMFMSFSMSLINDSLYFFTVSKMEAMGGSSWPFLFFKQLNKKYLQQGAKKPIWYLMLMNILLVNVNKNYFVKILGFCNRYWSLEFWIFYSHP